MGLPQNEEERKLYLKKAYTDIGIQVDVILEHILPELKEKFPNSVLDLEVRPFAPSLYVDIAKTRLDNLGMDTDDVVFEQFGLDTANTWLNTHYITKKKIDADEALAFFKDLKEKPVIAKLIEFAGHDNLYQWLQNNERQSEFFEKLKKEFPEIFSHFDYETTVEGLKIGLLSGAERKYRQECIANFMNENCDPSKWNTLESKLKDKLMTVAKWQLEKSEDWFNEEGKYVKSFKPAGLQKVTVVEVLPADKKDVLGEVGGKTIKFGFFGDYTMEFILAQKCRYDGESLKKFMMENEKGFEKKFDDLRKFVWYELVPRRYVAPETIEYLINGERVKSSQLLTGREDFKEMSNAYTYRLAVYHNFLKITNDMGTKLFNSREREKKNGTNKN